MNAEELTALAEDGESLTVEFKRGKKAGLNDRELIEAAVCMANGPGGILLIGVEDDGRITGADPRHGGRTDSTRLESLILNRTIPALITAVEIVAMPSGDVIVVDVPPARSPVGTKDGVYRRRSMRQDGKPECVPYGPNEMFSAYFSMTGLDFADTVARDATMNDLDPLEFERFRSMAGREGGDSSLAALADEEIGRALGVLHVRDGAVSDVTLGGILLFGRESALRRYLPNAECAFQVLDDTAVTTNIVSCAPLLKTAEDLYNLVRARNTEEELNWGLLRIAIQRIPERAARESIANALVHRDYAEQGMTLVQMLNDAFVVTSPGGFPPGVTQDNLLEASKPRSRTLADALKRAGLVERSGRGISLMYDALLRTGRAAPDFSRSTDRSVTVTFGTADADLGLARFIVAREEETQRPFTLNELRVLQDLRLLTSARIGELAEVLRLTETQVRFVLTALVEQGLIEPRGAGRGRLYHLSSAFYRMTEDPSAYIRIRGTEPIQNEQMVMNYVREFGSITRGKAADLCMLGGPQASHLLKRLRDSGQLSQHGERRGTYYSLP